jgi:hypothetical protein
MARVMRISSRQAQATGKFAHGRVRIALEPVRLGPASRAGTWFCGSPASSAAAAASSRYIQAPGSPRRAAMAPSRISAAALHHDFSGSPWAI